jgi:hypothetical protein
MMERLVSHDARRSVIAIRARVALSLGSLLVALAACSADGDDQRSGASSMGLAGRSVPLGPLAGTGAAAVGSIGAVPRAGVGAGAGAGSGAISGAAGKPPIPAATGGKGGSSPAAAGSAAAGMSAATAGSAGMIAMVPSGEGPTLPAIEGECPQLQNGTIMAAGHKGVVITAGSGKGGPLLFYWHGTAQSPAEANLQLPAAVREEITSSGGIIASFNGNQSSGAEGDCSGTMAHNIADFKAADLIAACAVKNNGIDPKRIYTTGCSAGGLQSGCMAQARSSYLAASAPNSGGAVFPQQWQDMHSPAIFTMHGGPGDMVFVTFSETSATLDMAAKTHGSFVVNCNHGGSHCGAPAALQTAAWKFMKDHPWGFGTSPWAGGIPAGVPEYCKIY